MAAAAPAAPAAERRQSLTGVLLGRQDPQAAQDAAVQGGNQALSEGS